MKTLTTLFLSAFFILSAAFTPVKKEMTGNPSVSKPARSSAGFDFFRTHRQGRAGVTATWGFSGAATGFIVERTYDDPADPYASWDIVSAQPCTGAKSYRCTETGVFPGYISYRVRALFSGGSSMETPVSTVHIVSH